MQIDKNHGVIVKGSDGKLKIKDKKYKDDIVGDFVENPKLKNLKEGDEIIYLSFTTNGEVVNVIKEKKAK